MLLGDAPIASLADDTNRAILCANIYPLARDDVLRKHPWDCLVTRVLLAPLAGAPAYGYAHWFAKPGDWLRTLDVGDDGGMDYRFESGRFLADATSLPLRYMASKSEGSWESHMVDVMVKRMKADLAYPITKSASLAESANAEYRDALQKAKSVDGMENPPEELGDAPFIDIRGG